VIIFHDQEIVRLGSCQKGPAPGDGHGHEFELAFAGSPSPALKSLDSGGRVVYIGSFAKSLFPGLRLGYIVAPEPLVAEARTLRSLILRHVPGHIQRAAAYFLAQGHYDAQVHKMARAYRERRNVAEQAIADQGLHIEGASSFGGSSIWMRAPDGVAATALARHLQNRQVLIEPGTPFFGIQSGGESFYRLAYSSISASQIPEGIRRIAETGRALAEHP
ncbi:MAG: PLP-dependent aminotransferase family protein, partial [Pseudomonadota bacterium]